DAWSATHQALTGNGISAPQMDEVLQEQRMQDNVKVTFQQDRMQLPHGTMFKVGEECYAVCDDRVLIWSFEGYTPANEQRLPGIVDVLTPRSVVAIYSEGFRPEFLPSVEAC